MTPPNPPLSHHILLVEDTDAVREVLARQLRALGCRVTAAQDGKHALALFQENLSPPVTMVITDLNMPHMNGQQLRDALRATAGEAQATLRIILLTADPVPPAYRGDYLQKPVALEDLRRLIEGENITHAEQNAPAGHRAIDEAALIDQMGELDDGALEMLRKFPDMMRPLMQRIIAAIEAEDYPAAEDTAHSLKGAARSVGARALGELCDTIQRKAAAREKGLQTYTESLQTAFVAVEDDLTRIFEG